jgi:hypothetical protein
MQGTTVQTPIESVPSRGQAEAALILMQQQQGSMKWQLPFYGSSHTADRGPYRICGWTGSSSQRNANHIPEAIPGTVDGA